MTDDAGAQRSFRMYTLYYSPGTACMVVHLMLIELGVPHAGHSITYRVALGRRYPDTVRRLSVI